MIYLLDTNTVSDLIVAHPVVTQHVERHRINRDIMALSQPVYYELMRGLIRTKATRKLSILRNRLMPVFDWVRLNDMDWLKSAEYWSNAIAIGKQLSDMDFLLAALAHRLNAIIVSSDADFDALPVQCEDWRNP